ncbi:MAG: hypothetical protein ACYCZR_03440 [Burkholderiales bacterium]
MNTFDDSVAMPDGQWQRLRNSAPRKNGVLGQRPSLSFVREIEPSWWHWDARTLDGSAGVASAVAAYWTWAKALRPIRFLFDPNHGDITMLALTVEALEVESQTDVAVSSVQTVPEGTYLLITLPGVITTNSGTEPRLRVGVLGEAGRAPSLFVFNGVTYAFGGTNNGMNVAPGQDPNIPAINFAYRPNDFGSGNTDFRPQGACVVRDRVVYFSGPNLYFSDRNEPLTVGYTGTLDAEGNIEPSTANPVTGTNFSARDTRGIFLGGEGLEDITAVAEVNTSADGSPIQSVVMAFTGTHAYMLLGEPLETTDTGRDGTGPLGSLQINRLNVQAGCVSQATITRTPYGTLWAGRDDVWFMPFGSLPIRVGTSIRPYLLDQPEGLRWKLHAEYDGGFYKLAMFAPGQGPTINDPCGMHLWLDLRNGGPQSDKQAQWFGPQLFVQTDSPTVSGGSGGPAGTWCMARNTKAEGDGRLYALQRFFINSPDLGLVNGLSLCSLDTYEGADTTSPQASVSEPWQPAYGYGEGDWFVPSPKADAAPYAAPIWVCTTTGTSGSTTEPDWLAATATGTITDGTVVWHLRYWDGSYPMSAYTPKVHGQTNQIEWSLLSKEFTLGDTMTEKLLDGAEISYWAADRTQLTYNSHPEQDSRSRVLALASGQADNLLDTMRGNRVWQRKLLTPSPTSRFSALTATWECAQDAGIVITAGVNDTITLGVTEPGVASYLLTIPAGFYENIRAVGTAVQTALAAEIGGVNLLSSDPTTRPLIGFQNDQGGTLTVTTDSRLAQLFGFSPNQGATVSAVYPESVFGWESPAYATAPDMQISGINLRYRTFGRRPS